MYISEAFVAVILSQTRNTWLLIFFSATFKKRQRQRSSFLQLHPLEGGFMARMGFGMAQTFIWFIRHMEVFIFIFFHCLEYFSSSVDVLNDGVSLSAGHCLIPSRNNINFLNIFLQLYSLFHIV
ncbi:hypothetical protein T05_9540 [Trichinella murrelli]|uniref:Uncharacterized protein n=1 Tax=Trichinella murrelli TaxID=144512 RepID=A0A0V0TJC1_9BILA|nr:hypothetical protein T05_9540 [Trichinella murrelli]